MARGGELVHQSVLGQASLESGQPLAEDSLVRIYSMTKPITSVAFMMLVEEGLVALDDPVHRFIPSWRDLGVYVGGGGGLPGTPPGWLTQPTDAPMRVIDLLRHTSGLTYGFQNRTNVDAAYRANQLDTFARSDGLQGFVDALAQVPLEFSPGDGLELLGRRPTWSATWSARSPASPSRSSCRRASSSRWACSTPPSTSTQTRPRGWRSAT